MTVSARNMSKEIRIRQADNGGYIVSATDENYNTKDHTYSNLDGVKGCLDKSFGTKGKKPKDTYEE